MAYREQKMVDAIRLTHYPNKPMEAYYLETKEINTRFGEQQLHVFEKKGGVKISVWGFTALNRLLEMTPKGTLCKFTYTGLSKDKNKYGKQVHTCTLFFDEDDKMRIEGIPEHESEEEGNGSDLPF